MTRSDTESKNAPRGPAVPEALATAPSSRSGSAHSTSRSRPARSAPLPMATAAPPASTTPVAVRWSAVMPVRRMFAPMGLRPCSKLDRQRPSNIEVLRSSVGIGAGPGYPEGRPASDIGQPRPSARGPAAGARPVREQEVVAGLRDDLHRGAREPGGQPRAHRRGRDAVELAVARAAPRACTRAEVEARRQLVAGGPAPRPASPAGHPGLEARGERLGRARDRGQLARDRPRPAPSSTCSRARSSVSGCGHQVRARPRRPAPRATASGGHLDQRTSGRTEGGDHRGVGVGLGRGHRGHEWSSARTRSRAPWRRRARPDRRRTTRAARPASMPERVEQRPPRSSPNDVSVGDGVGVVSPTPGPVDGEQPDAGAARPSESSGWRARRESGVPCRYTTGAPSGSPDVVEGEDPPVGQLDPTQAHERTLGASGTLPELATNPCEGGAAVQLFSSEKVRNVALVGHGGAGKTTLAEALLHRAGAVNRLGRVEDGTTVCDHEPEEQARGLSLSLALAPFEWNGHKVNLVDTPGYADFLGDVIAALRVVDLAVFVVSAVDGVEVQTEAIWREAARLGVPRMVFVNKLDRERASFERTLDELRDKLGAGVAPLELPIGAEADFRGIADLLTDTAHIYVDGVPHTEPIPDEMEALEHQVHDNLVEGIVVADDQLLERYLEGDQPDVHRAGAHAHARHRDGERLPGRVRLGHSTRSASTGWPTSSWRSGRRPPTGRPSSPPATPRSRSRPTRTPSRSRSRSRRSPTRSWASSRCSRSCRARSATTTTSINSRSGTEERLHGLFVVRGKEHEPVDALCRGRPRRRRQALRHAHRRHARPARPPGAGRPRSSTPAAVLAAAVVPATQADDDKLASALHRLQEEDPVPPRRAGRGDAPDPPLGHGRHAPRDRRRAARAEVRREGHHRAGADPLPRDDHRAAATATSTRTRSSPAATASTRGWSSTSSRSSGASGFEFVDKVVGGADRQGLHPRGGQGRRGGDGRRRTERPPGGRRAASPSSTARSTASTATRWPSAPRAAWRSRRRSPRPDPVVLEPISAVDVVVPDRPARRRDGRPQRPPRPRAGHRAGRTGRAGGHRAHRARRASSCATPPSCARSPAGAAASRAEHDHYDVLPPGGT